MSMIILNCFSFIFSQNSPRSFFRRRNTDGMIKQLLQGYKADNIDDAMSKLVKKAEYDLEKAERGVVFLDTMDKIGDEYSAEFSSEEKSRLILREIIGE